MARDITASLIASLKNKTTSVSVEGESVIIELKLGDAYLAEVLCDDLNDRMRDGKGISLELTPPRPSK